MKRDYQMLINIILFIGLLVALFYTFYKPQKIVYVDSNKLLSEYSGMKSAMKAYENKSKGWQANIDTLARELEGAVKKFEGERPTLTAKEVKLSEELLRNKQNQFIQYKNAIEQKASEEDQKLQQEVLMKVNGYIKEYGKEKGYSIIMGATTMGNIVYAEENIDITEEILKGLNEAYKK